MRKAEHAQIEILTILIFELTRIIMVSERAAPGSEGGADR